MTTLTRYDGVDEILNRLSAVRVSRRLNALLTGAMAVTTFACGGLLIATAATGYWPDQPPTVLRWSLLGVLVATWVVVAAVLVLRPMLGRLNLAQTARLVEQHVEGLDNSLINSVLLAGDDAQSSPELVAAAIGESARRVREIDLRRSISKRPLKRWTVAATIAAVLLIAFSQLQAGPFRRGLQAVFQPGRFVRNLGTVELLDLTPADATIFAGEEVTILADVRNDRGEQLIGQVIFDGADPQRMLAGNAYGTFKLPLGRIDQTLRYAVRIGDTRWPDDRPYYELTVLQRVEVESVSLKIDYPNYTGLEPQTVVKPVADASFEAPIGSGVTVDVRLSAAVPAVMLERPGKPALRMEPSLDGLTCSAVIGVDADSGYRIALRGADGRALQRFPEPPQDADEIDGHGGSGEGLLRGYYLIKAVEDPAPKVSFLAPNRDVSAAPGEKVRLRIKATDRYGLANVKLLVGPEDRSPQPDMIRSLSGQAQEIIEYEYVVEEKLPADRGIVLVYHATATDRRDLSGYGPQTSASPRFKILVQDAAKVAAERAKRYEELRRRLLALLESQGRHRIDTNVVRDRHVRMVELTATGNADRTVRELAGEIHRTVTALQDGQTAIRTEMIDLVENFRFDPELASIQQALALLANNEAALAIEQAVVLRDVVAAKNLTDSALPGRRDQAAGQLMRSQNKILEALKMMLQIMPSLAKQGEKNAGTGDDIPPEAAEKLRELKSALEEFVEAEKKAIEASKRLTKKPVDTFTAEDQKVLNDLIATQDKWEKFLNESFADFSRLAQQDFSNPVLMKELLSVKADITLAKDALKKKAMEIATALEDSGTENAESLTANIEKWLPDEPDRVKWAMEAPDQQDNIEMPELPTELEDLVGDLLEEEEDLFDEMEDVSSKAFMSGDKGIGWDALEGPISNMNAQGVTGNQLPNNMELSGRSGEGRTGKSSGEFVEDKAVGKGGRRTPTRLSADAFMKGEIDDRSTDPPGGATGGGKLSGAGQEGLEGPVPPPLAKEMQRLAGKQANLINRAERIRANFRVDDYRSFRLLEAITLMDRVRRDLEAGRYQHAMRRRDETRAALKQAGLLLAGEIEVRSDASASMPKYVRDDIADAMQGKLPAAYRSALEQYYRRISQGESGK